MIDRKTGLACSALIAPMLVLAVWRILTLDDWTTLALPNGSPLPALILLLFPACSALVVGALHWDSRGARADSARIRPWCNWAKSLSIGYCGGLLLLQGVLIIRSLDLDVALDFSAIGRALGIVLAILALLSINQMPKLPWFEPRFAPGGDLGPIYGPRYLRTQSRITVAVMLAVIAYSLAVPPTIAWRSVPYILLATACLVLWSIAWRVHLGRKWKLERSACR
ncbi:MAG: hypothetical protein JOY64_25940 [Alphaproteobacteria bacterium]|nr:hypothetical protein [Alphaproteobacteria bacterium]MBV8411095.1 hypothetical protein [Alphaproteobacteria bacterium]